MKKLALVLVFFLSILTVTFRSYGDNVSGEFKTKKKGSIKPTSVGAFHDRSPRDPFKKVMVIVLSEGMVRAQEAIKELSPHTALINQEGMRGKNYITFMIHSDNYVGMNATFSEGNVQYIDSTKDKSGESITAQSLEATFSQNTPDRVAGRIRTTKPATTMSGDTYELDVTFDTVVSRPPASQKLTAGGGEPGKALQDLITAIKANNWKVLRTRVKAEKLQSLVDPNASDEENFKSVIDSISMMLPKGKTKVIGGEQMADTAVLELQGEMSEGIEALYLVRMVKEATGWCFDRSSVVGML